MRPELAINLVTLGPSIDFGAAVRLCAAYGIQHIGVTKEQVRSIGAGEANRVLRGEGISVTGYARVPAFPRRDEGGWQAALDEAFRVVDEARTIGAATLIATGGQSGGEYKDLHRARLYFAEGLEILLHRARQVGLPVSLEPLHPMYAADRGLFFTLRQAVDFCHTLPDKVGVIVDAYHLWWDPNFVDDLTRATGLIRGYHISDWRLPTRSLLTDRAMMGDGCIDLPRLRRLVEEAGYRGPHEVEIFSELDWWKRAPEETLKTCIERFATHC
ncbi:sugar phosphate isomerase/epimerase family protein [Rhizobium leguminosarum]|uniref:sugar phosphate isomerase/epimerase family protein n=1 Tax=Rhizobium leguminosarum TaxID=384 RepID=UPI001C962917|nr:sugar phosphate isomerase/epimerase [Rhizobium leguminosarum]MBY5377281.1 sugar phosphate isomerase/epimerase [Rhizobium leguminosarum]